MHIGELQQVIKQRDYKPELVKDYFLKIVEEVGELASALAGDDKADKAEEFADVLAWLCTLANINDVDLEKAVQKYTAGGVEGFK